MWIEKIQIKNFGKFHEKTIEFEPGLNIVYGANESGKTTIHNFLTGMLFGIEKSRGRAGRDDLYGAYEPWNSASFYVGNMIMQIDGKRFFLERNFYHKEKSAKLRNLEDNEELSVEFGDLSMLLGGLTRENYQNTYCIRQAGFLADESLAGALENYMSDVSNSGDGSVRIQAALEDLSNKKKAVEKEQKKSAAARMEAAERLSMEAELLKKDIILHKNRSNAEKLATDDNRKEEHASEWETVHRVEIRWGLLIGILLLFAGGGLFLTGGIARWIGILCMLLALGICYIAGIRYSNKTVGKDTDEIPEELADELHFMQEQWKEKENRYYNIEEQLLELAEPSKEERELAQDVKALELAIQTIQRISAQIYEDVSDGLHEAVSKNISQITSGKYDSIILEEDLKLFVWENGKKIPVGQLSRGTLEQAYLAMRMAVGSILIQEEPMPVLLDETFSMYDDKRLADTLTWLLKRQEQIIMFTCQKRELEVLERMNVSCNKIILDEGAL